jgi:hypothetical protein
VSAAYKKERLEMARNFNARVREKLHIHFGIM